jgi:cytochrome c biogenesis protein CcdA
MIGSLLLIGLLLGMKHAIEADHVAAVATLATSSRRLRDTVTLAAMWGVGHAGMLVIVGVLVIALRITLPEPLPEIFEGLVGVMLIVLGIGVLRRLRARGVHVHAHSHDDGTVHLHAHAHAHEAAAVHVDPHRPHAHVHVPVSRALLVGSIHGLAGSAALVLLALQAASSRATAIACLVAFSVGTVLGMMVFSLAISLPLRASSRRWGALPRAIEGLLGTATMALGAWILIAALAP